MRKLFLIAALCAPLLWSCSDDDDNGYGGGDQTMVLSVPYGYNYETVYFDHDYDRIEIEGDWLNIQKGEKQGLKYAYNISFTGNPSEFSRTAVVNLKSLSKTRTMKIVQAGNFEFQCNTDLYISSLYLYQFSADDDRLLFSGYLDNISVYDLTGYGNEYAKLRAQMYFHGVYNELWWGMTKPIIFAYPWIENPGSAPTANDARKAMQKPFYVGFEDWNHTINSNVTEDNLFINAFGTYRNPEYWFRSFRLDNPYDNTYYILDGFMRFELAE